MRNSAFTSDAERQEMLDLIRGRMAEAGG